MIRTILLAGLLGAGFDFSPVPRWSEPPSTEAACAAVERECAKMIRGAGIGGELGYDASGPDLPDFTLEGPPGTRLDGVRIVKAETTGIDLDCAG